MLPISLLMTKLHRPPADSHWVARPELIRRLHQGLNRRLTLISAPPGFGKTTLVSQWLDQNSEWRVGNAESLDSAFPTPRSARRTEVAWLSLDAGDNQLGQFLHYLIGAVRTCVPEACAATQRLLIAAERPSAPYPPRRAVELGAAACRAADHRVARPRSVLCAG